ncbi:MAG: hypothetical protein K0Q71_361 [Thermomicrobiales bacterium]|jgi:hypothetical protein|nr:hypothetical protein [Thermomicrobiales bacterium]
MTFGHQARQQERAPMPVKHPASHDRRLSSTAQTRATLPSGSRLDATTRSTLASRFGHDFGNVRIHTDRAAAKSAREHHARAYTVGRDIVFAAGEYRPHTPAGRWLLAHELAHVVQQGQRSYAHATASADGAPRAAEREARAAATSAVAGSAPVTITRQVTGPVVQKQDAGMDEPAPVPMQAPAGGWSTADLSVAVRSSKARTHEGGAGSGCLGLAGPGNTQAFSACGRVEEFCATPAVYPFRVWFHVDSQGMPRPQPFRMPTVEVIWQFVGANGASQNGQLKDAAPRYAGDGRPLAPSFGEDLRISAASGGQLWLTAALADPDSGAGVTYRDHIECRLVPCA